MYFGENNNLKTYSSPSLVLLCGTPFAQYLCTGFGNAYNYVLEGSSEYTVGVPQSSTKGDGLYDYNIFSNAAHVFF